MERTRVVTLAVAAIAIVAVLAPTTAAASLPTPTHAKIKPFKKIGAVKLGISKAKAFEEWGGGQCALEDSGGETCVWLSASPADFPAEGAAVQLFGGEVCGMFIRAGTPFSGGGQTITGLKKWKTEEGVGLGSKLKAAKKVLGGGKLSKEKHGVTTSFIQSFASGSEDRVGEITIFKDGCNVT